MADGSLKLVRPYQSILVHIQIRDRKASLFQIITGMQHGMVLYFGCDDMLPLCLAGLRRRNQRPVVRLRTARREVYLLG